MLFICDHLDLMFKENEAKNLRKIKVKEKSSVLKPK